MSELDDLSESIEDHIAECKQEMAALQAARAALLGEHVTGSTAAVSAKRTPPRQRHTVAKTVDSRPGTEVAADDAEGSDGEAPAPMAGRPSAAPTPRARARSRPPEAAGSDKPVEVLLAGKLEAMLRESEDGLSAITVAKRANARFKQVLDLLRELEQGGQVRSSGTRRTSLWRFVTDEQRIAERAAELARL